MNDAPPDYIEELKESVYLLESFAPCKIKGTEEVRPRRGYGMGFRLWDRIVSTHHFIRPDYIKVDDKDLPIELLEEPKIYLGERMLRVLFGEEGKDISILEVPEGTEGRPLSPCFDEVLPRDEVVVIGHRYSSSPEGETKRRMKSVKPGKVTYKNVAGWHKIKKIDMFNVRPTTENKMVKGDSGSPVLSRRNGKYSVVGMITSGNSEKNEFSAHNMRSIFLEIYCYL